MVNRVKLKNIKNIKSLVEYYVSLPYTTTIEKSSGPRGDYYVARIIELPDLLMTGDTPEEALKELEDEKPEYIELYLRLGNRMPEPLRPATTAARLCCDCRHLCMKTLSNWQPWKG